jgi:hypothetical protein
MFARISMLLCVVASVALLFASDYTIWHILPLSFEFTCVFSFFFGAALSVLAVVFAFVGLFKTGKSKFNVGICTWSVAEFLAFGFVYLYALFSD